MKYTKSLNYVLNQNVNVPKRARFATFPLSIVDHFCLLQQYKLIFVERLFFRKWCAVLKSTLYVEREQHLYVLLQRANNLKPKSMGYGLLIGQSRDFWRAYSLFLAREASFVPRLYESHK